MDCCQKKSVIVYYTHVCHKWKHVLDYMTYCYIKSSSSNLHNRKTSDSNTYQIMMKTAHTAYKKHTYINIVSKKLASLSEM